VSDGAGTRRQAGLRRLRSLRFAAMRWIASASYVRKWVVLGIAIGIIAGCGAIVFDEALQAASALFSMLWRGIASPPRSVRATSRRGPGRRDRGRCR
jgi:chloride channel protein, CIC family